MSSGLSVDGAQLESLGYVLVRKIFDAREVNAIAERLEEALALQDRAVLRSRGQTYGSRDLIRVFPEVCEIPQRPRLKELLAEVVGRGAGLVRALFFDKPPERAWSLAWHRDRTIAVKNNRLPTTQFRSPTLKAGIPHVEAPEALLARMLALRVHFDPMIAENGPLAVIPGSQTVEHEADQPPVEIHADAGDVLAMRPLLSHSSSLPRAGTTMHRRIIHLEFAPSVELPDGYEWYWFRPVT